MIDKFNIEDFEKKNILNKYILEECIINNKKEHIVKITDRLYDQEKLLRLKKVLSKISDNLLRDFTLILIHENKYNTLLFLFDKFEEEYERALSIIVVTLFSELEIEEGKNFHGFVKAIESNSKILEFISENNEKSIINFSKIGVKFKKLNGINISHNVLLKIIDRNLFEVNANNVQYILGRLINKEILYRKLILPLCGICQRCC